MSNKAKLQPVRSQTQAKKTRKELESSLHRLKLELEETTKRLDAQLAGLSQGSRVIWNNQRELAKSEELLDEQFAVSTRLSISSLNKLFDIVGKPELKVGEKQIEDTFKDWAEFKKRSDFRELMLEWMMGTAIADMPEEKKPQPIEAKKEDGESDVKSDDGNTVDEQERPANSQPRQEPDVPAMQG